MAVERWSCPSEKSDQEVQWNYRIRRYAFQTAFYQFHYDVRIVACGILPIDSTLTFSVKILF